MGTEGSQKPKADRKQRLAEQLRANLQRRKAQARSRREGEAGGEGTAPQPDEEREDQAGPPARR